MLALLVALAGAGGAVARYGADWAVKRWRATQFPAATLTINVSGSLLLGVLTGLTVHHVVRGGGSGADAITVAGTGFCGGYTTFSTATFESVRLIQLRRYRLAAVNTVASIVLTTLAAALGLLITA